MKSLRYMLGGKPVKLDDCVDRSLRDRPMHVTLELEACDHVTDMHVFKGLIGKFRWTFPGLEVCCEDFCGGYFISDSPARRHHRIVQANRKLTQRLSQLRQRGIEILAPVEEFEPNRS